MKYFLKVQATHRDPVPGYADSLLGALGAGAGIMVGLLRVMKCNPDALFDIVPADFVIDSTLAVARFGAEKSFEGDNSIVFNCTIGNARPVTIRNYFSCICVFINFTFFKAQSFIR